MSKYSIGDIVLFNKGYEEPFYAGSLDTRSILPLIKFNNQKAKIVGIINFWIPTVYCVDYGQSIAIYISEFDVIKELNNEG